MISNSFLPNIGGVEKHLYHVSKELQKKNFKITVLTLTKNKKLLSEETIDSIRIHRHFKTNFLNKIIWLFKNRDLISESDTIHCHDQFVFTHWYLPFRLLYPKKPVYITFHGYEGNYPVSKIKILQRKVTEILTRGNISIGDYLKKYYHTKPTYISYGGTNPQQNITTNHNNSFLYLGRLEPDTGFPIYLKAIEILEKKYHINPILNICGNGKLKKTIPNNKNIKFHGFVKNPNEFIKKSDFILTSGYLAILESMSYGKIVFSVYDNQLKKDYLYSIPNHSDKMFISSSPEELANSIFKVTNNSKIIPRMKKNAFRFSLNNTWKHLSNTYIKLWDKQ